jgi:hypothetical protein
LPASFEFVEATAGFEIASSSGPFTPLEEVSSRIPLELDTTAENESPLVESEAMQKPTVPI